jgi:hypothetical protein
MRGCGLLIVAVLAWVLWTESEETTRLYLRDRPAQTNTVYDWKRGAGYESQGPCETALRYTANYLYERMVGLAGANVVRTSRGIVVTTRERDAVTSIRTEMTCFHDTVDPRR